MERLRHAWLVALATAVLVVTAGCGSAAAPASSGGTVKLGWVPSSAELPILVAQYKDYFQDEGVDVDLVKVNSGAEAIPLVATGRLDALMASASASMFNALASGLKFKVVASDNVNPAATADGVCPSPLMVRTSLVQDGSIKAIGDIEGRKIAVPGGLGTGGAFYLQKMLSSGGRSVKDNDIVQMAGPDAEAALRSGAIDAAQSYEPFASAMVASGAAVRFACPPAGVGITHLLYGESLTSRPDTAKALYTAFARASHDLQQSETKASDETKQAIVEATGLTRDAVNKLPPYDYKVNLPPLSDVLGEMQTFFRSVGTLDYETDLQISSFVDEAYYLSVGQ